MLIMVRVRINILGELLCCQNSQLSIQRIISLPSPVGELAPAIHATLDIYGQMIDVIVSHNGITIVVSS